MGKICCMPDACYEASLASISSALLALHLILKLRELAAFAALAADILTAPLMCWYCIHGMTRVLDAKGHD